VALIEDKREAIEKLAETLLEKETLNLPQIIEILGERPFPMKETMKDYLVEIEERQKQEDVAAETAETATDEVTEAETEPVESTEENAAETPSSEKEDNSESDKKEK
jgi:hypothetical protein